MKKIPTLLAQVFKTCLLMVFCWLGVTNAWAQQPYYEWRIGGGVGVMNYYGDLSYRARTTSFRFPAYTLFIEKKISPSVGVQLNGTLGKIAGNDRTQDWKGNLVTANPNFGRALNFQTDIRTANLAFVYHFDNGKLLSKYATFAPYLLAGVGFTDFTVYGDLFDSQGGRYYYWDDNTVRSQPPGTPGDVPVIDQDGKYETKLTGLNTERSYPTTVWNIPVGVGLKIKLADQLSASVQVNATYAFTDYLDDVSGTYSRAGFDNPLQSYAANPSGTIREPRGEGKPNHDIYFSTVITLNYHFGYAQKPFKAPLVYTGYEGVHAPVPVTKKSPEANRPVSTLEPTSVQPDSIAITTPSVATPDSLQTYQTYHISDSTARLANDTLARTVTGQEAIPYSPQLFNQSEQLRADSLRRAYVSDSIARRETPTDKKEATAIPYSAKPIGETESLRTDSLRSAVRTSSNPKQSTNYQREQSSDRDIESQQRTDAARELDRRRQEQDLAALDAENRRRQEDAARDAENRRQDAERSLNNRKQDAERDLQNRRDEVARQERANREEREALERERQNRSGNRDNYRSSATTVVPVPIPAGSNRRDTVYIRDVNTKPTSVNELRTDLNRLRSELTTMRSQNDPAVNQKLDSLLNLVSTLDRQAMGPASPGADTLTTQTTTVRTRPDSLVTAMQSQLQTLNNSLAELRNGSQKAEALKNYGTQVIYYGVNKAALTPADQQRLDVLADKLKSDPAVKLNVKGFTDKTGNPEYNLMLSKRRAGGIVKYLTEVRGVNPNQILVNYFGGVQATQKKSNPYQRKVELELFVD